jgi:hypothetical protein
VENLLFFNEKGYPYNFTYNDEKWEGKLIFDENASDTFKTIGMYIFEKVEPIEFVSSSDFKKITYYDNSGITFTGDVNYENETITGIEKVNTSLEFYSKWIIGDNFHTKFPKGTIIELGDVTGIASSTSDFDSSNYFTVVDNRNDAIMIISDTDNNSFNFTFSAGTINTSLNVISINDYNRNIYHTDDFLQNIFIEKKLSIINSDDNDKIIGITNTGQTISYINSIEMSGTVGDTFKLRLYFLTERPKLYKGRTQLSCDNGICTMNLTKLDSNFYPGADFTIEDNIGNNLYSAFSFTVTYIEKSILLGTKSINFIKNTSQIYSRGISSTIEAQDYWIQYSNYLDVKKDDIIYLSATTFTTAIQPKNHDRTFKVLNTNFSGGIQTLRVKSLFIQESGVTYKIIKNLKPSQQTNMIVTPSGYIPNGYNIIETDATIYSTNNYLDFTQEILHETGTTYYNTTASFLEQHKSNLSRYGLETYHYENNNIGYLNTESLYGTYKPYIYTSGYTNNVKLYDNHSLSTNGITKRYDIFSNTQLTNEKTWLYENDKLSRMSSASYLLDLFFNTSYYGLKLLLNGNEYFIRYNTNTQTTIDDFITKWGEILDYNGFTIYSGVTTEGYTFNVLGNSSDVNIWSIDIYVNLLSTKTEISHIQNQGTLISGNEIRSNAINYFNIGLSTGMIINISGSSYYDNNKEYNIIGLSEDKIQLSYQGPFFTNSGMQINAKTRDFIRKPRSDYYKDISFKISWIPIEDRINVIDETIFFYDVSGSQLTPYKDIDALKYTGTLPLIDDITNNTVYLNNGQNIFSGRTTNPKYQQTVFDDLEYKLEQFDSSVEYNWISTPLEFYIGYNSKIEGVNSNLMKIEKVEKFENTDILFNISGNTTPGYNETNNFYFSGNTMIFKHSFINLEKYGFEEGQIIEFRFKDQILTEQQIFENVDLYTIESINRNSLVLDKTGVTFTTTGSTFSYKIEVQPKEIGRFSVYGQTEIEDIRFKVNLNNVGVQISDDTAKIFKESDIKDNAVDYNLLNKKRKEMLTNYREIYDYIGSYKGLINAINFFGYTDLELYEYYRNVDKTSQLYKKLQKVWIPDIFDNSVEGWNEIDFIAGKYQNHIKWTKTNLFNLTYKITDEDGNNVLMYTLEEVQYKLNKLKGWLRQNVIPISANLLDITGVADVPHTLYQDYDESNQVKGSHIEREATIVNFNYSATLNFGTDYLISVNFYILSGGTFDGILSGTTKSTFSEVPNFYTAKIKTFYLSGTTMIPVQYHKLSKNDMTPYSFNIDKLVDPYIYIETTTFSNDGSGLGIKNNKMYYYDEPRNHWLVNHNFDMTKYKYILSSDFISNEIEKEELALMENTYSTAINTPVETNINISTIKVDTLK